MDSTAPAAAIYRCNLGAAAAFDQSIYPVGYYESGSNFDRGCLLLEATMDEMVHITQQGIDLNKNDDFIFETRVRVHDLKERRAKIRQHRKTLNPIKALQNIRRAQEFHDVSKSVFLETKRTSEKIQREEGKVHVVPSSHIQRRDREIPPNAAFDGIFVNFPNGMDENARRVMDAMAVLTNNDPFDDDPLVSQLREGERAVTVDESASCQDMDASDSGVIDGNQSSIASSNIQSRPTSPRVINIVNIIRESIFTSRSTVNGLTVNRGSNNIGACVVQESAP